MALYFNLTRNSKDFLIPVSLKNLHVGKKKGKKTRKNFRDLSDTLEDMMTSKPKWLHETIQIMRLNIPLSTTGF